MAERDQASLGQTPAVQAPPRACPKGAGVGRRAGRLWSLLDGRVCSGGRLTYGTGWGGWLGCVLVLDGVTHHFLSRQSRPLVCTSCLACGLPVARPGVCGLGCDPWSLVLEVVGPWLHVATHRAGPGPRCGQWWLKRTP